jgi:hypothetical protein
MMSGGFAGLSHHQLQIQPFGICQLSGLVEGDGLAENGAWIHGSF